MHPKSIPTKNKRKKIVFGFMIIASVLLIPLILDDSTRDISNDSSLFPSPANGGNYDILKFWANEIERVNNTPLNIIFGIIVL